MTWPGLEPVDLSHEAANTNSLIWPDLLIYEAANTNSIVFDMTWPDLKPVIYHTK